jgi:hypothetical protein
MTEREKPDLRSIEPIGPPPGDDEVLAEEESAGRVGRVGAAVTGAPPAVGVEADTVRRERDAESPTSPEAEAELDALRRD